MLYAKMQTMQICPLKPDSRNKKLRNFKRNAYFLTGHVPTKMQTNRNVSIVRSFDLTGREPTDSRSKRYRRLRTKAQFLPKHQRGYPLVSSSGPTVPDFHEHGHL